MEAAGKGQQLGSSQATAGADVVAAAAAGAGASTGLATGVASRQEEQARYCDYRRMRV